MRCYICNKILEKPEWNRDHEDFDPCPVCLLEINELIAAYDDLPYSPEDNDLGPEWEEILGALEEVADFP